MKYFNDLICERKSINNARRIEEQDKQYNESVKQELKKFGVTSATELDAEQYEIFLEQLKKIKNRFKIVEKNSETVQPQKQTSKPLPKNETVVLTEKQKSIIQELVNVLTIDEAKTKLVEIFQKSSPNFVSVSIFENDKISVNFKTNSYTFVKGAAVNEAKITTDEQFTEYANKVLKKAFGDKFDQKIADDVVKGLLKKYSGDYGAMIGALTKG
jgi:3-phenylpropionate/cinnamic acid dioxygenase small subunit